jgi:hypothetical protein
VRTPDTILLDTEWAALSTAYGPGTDVPPHLRALLSEDPEACTAAVGFLEGNLLHQQSLYPATAPATEFTAAVLDDPRVSVCCESALDVTDPRPLRADLLEWIALVAESIEYTLDRKRDDAEEACFRLAPELAEAVLPYAGDADPDVRRAAVHALTHLLTVPAPAGRRAAVAERLLAEAREAPPDVRAATADALARWGMAPTALLRDDHPGVRGHAAMAPTLDDDPAARDELRTALRDPVAADHWFGPPLPWGEPARTKLAAALLRRTSTFDEVAAEAAALARVADRYSLTHELREMLARYTGSMDRPDAALVPVLAAFAANDGLWSSDALREIGIHRDRDELRALVRAYE